MGIRAQLHALSTTNLLIMIHSARTYRIGYGKADIDEIQAGGASPDISIMCLKFWPLFSGRFRLVIMLWSGSMSSSWPCYWQTAASEMTSDACQSMENTGALIVRQCPTDWYPMSTSIFPEPFPELCRFGCYTRNDSTNVGAIAA